MTNGDRVRAAVELCERLKPYRWLPSEQSPVRDPREALKAFERGINCPKVDDTDRQIGELCKYYASAPEEDRAAIRRAPVPGRTLLHFAGRMAVRAMRGGGEGCVWLGLLAVSLGDCTGDLRDTLAVLAMLRHAALKLGADWRSLFTTVAQISSPHAAQIISGFTRRAEQSATLAAFLLREGHDANGPTIEFVLDVDTGT